jgi:exopolyphosphatase/guanosine-5'-triphosphate,3'-diphosphate pyrophosphatase
MYGIIDIGSNTMRLSCYRVVEKQLIHVFHKKSMAGLAGYVDEKNNMTDAGVEKAIETLEDFKNIVMCIGLDKLYVIATASLRNVDNTDKILKKIADRTGIEIQILSGEQEAMYDYKGATYCTDTKNGMVVDIGGGSTELVCFKDDVAGTAVSLPIGSLNTFSKFVNGMFPTAKEEKNIREYVKAQLEKIDIKKQQKILGVGGTNRACMKLYNDYYNLSSTNSEMECDKIPELLEAISGGEKKDVNKILKIIPDRIHTIIPGMLILDEIQKYYKCKSIKLSTWGVREGYMIEKVL